jgi:hypothetical protein
MSQIPVDPSYDALYRQFIREASVYAERLGGRPADERDLSPGTRAWVRHFLPGYNICLNAVDTVLYGQRQIEELGQIGQLITHQAPEVDEATRREIQTMRAPDLHPLVRDMHQRMVVFIAGQTFAYAAALFRAWILAIQRVLCVLTPTLQQIIHAFAEQVVQDLTAIAHDSYHFSVATGTYLLPDDTRSHHADYAGYAARRQQLQQDLDHAQS